VRADQIRSVHGGAYRAAQLMPPVLKLGKKQNRPARGATLIRSDRNAGFWTTGNGEATLSLHKQSLDRDDGAN
jgi:hypothetical protein